MDEQFAIRDRKIWREDTGCAVQETRPARQSIPDCAEPKSTGKHSPAEDRTVEERMEKQARDSFNDANSCCGSFSLQVCIFTDWFSDGLLSLWGIFPQLISDSRNREPSRQTYQSGKPNYPCDLIVTSPVPEGHHTIHSELVSVPILSHCSTTYAPHSMSHVCPLYNLGVTVSILKATHRTLVPYSTQFRPHWNKFSDLPPLISLQFLSFSGENVWIWLWRPLEPYHLN